MRALLPIATVLCLGCGSSRTECTCADPSLVIHVPADRAPSVVGITASGPACDGAKATCVQATAAGCEAFALRAGAAGACHIDVDFSAGPPRFSADVRLVPGACCGGFYADPASAADIEVPSAADAGGAG